MKSRPAHFERLLNFLRRKGRSHEDAEDLIQEAMLRLHRYRKAAPPMEAEPVLNEEAFLTHAVQNLSVDLHRSRRPDIRREVPFERFNSRTPLVDNDTPEKFVDAEQRLNCIQKILDAASVRSDIYFAQRAGYSYDEIAAHFNVSHMTIRRHIARALLIIMEQGPPG
jgi:RNA polymerase sigma factor (sigma-70 family)